MKIYNILICLFIITLSPLIIFAEEPLSPPVKVKECNFPDNMNCFQNRDIADAEEVNANFQALIDRIEKLQSALVNYGIMEEDGSIVERYPFVLGLSHFNLNHGNSCFGYVYQEDDRCPIDFVHNFFSIQIVAYGFNGSINSANNLGQTGVANTSIFYYGYSYAHFLKNEGESKQISIGFHSCNDVIIYIAQGEITDTSLGDTINLVYHRFPLNEDGGKDCPCENLNQTFTFPKGNFRLIFLTRGSNCTSYINFPMTWMKGNNIKIDFKGLNTFVR